MPGSPCWKQGQLKVGDLITKVAQGDKEPVDIVGMRVDDAVKLIRGKKGTEVRLTVKKPDGSIVVIPIIRDGRPNERRQKFHNRTAVGSLPAIEARVHRH